jgi:hypothetical protein
MIVTIDDFIIISYDKNKFSHNNDIVKILFPNITFQLRLNFPDVTWQGLHAETSEACRDTTHMNTLRPYAFESHFCVRNANTAAVCFNTTQPPNSSHAAHRKPNSVLST